MRGSYLARGELKVGYSHRFASHRLGLDFYKAILDFACGTSHRIWTVCGGKSSGKLCSRFVILRGYSYRFACIFVLWFCRDVQLIVGVVRKEIKSTRGSWRL